MKLTARFVSSAFTPAGNPPWERVEIAFAGRSNVGKSSLLNALAGVRGLARTSRTPGRTRSLNFFELGDTLALVDLPGYGYAAIAHTEAERIAALLRNYVTERRNLAALVMLIDARRGPGAEERELAAIVTGREIDLIVVATKCDKLRAAERAALPRLFAPLGLEPILTSAHKDQGIDQLRRRLLRYAARPAAGDNARG
ncbi:MAG TPA: ribosome biogenesis GTP-binding protein YihA/YsxC [Candidatus Binataceae bacterium]|nr:ribosome biogenesis GTP-binding protein YihA/YsxC [Candidatus Binataceae bacterium]